MQFRHLLSTFVRTPFQRRSLGLLLGISLFTVFSPATAGQPIYSWGGIAYIPGAYNPDNGPCLESGRCFLSVAAAEADADRFCGQPQGWVYYPDAWWHNDPPSKCGYYYVYVSTWCPNGDQIQVTPGGTICTSPLDVQRNLGKSPKVRLIADPINTATGNNVRVEVDYTGAGPFPLTFERTYNSQGNFFGKAVGINWRHTYDANIYVTSAYDVTVYRASGVNFRVLNQNGIWNLPASSNDRFVRLTDAAGQTTGWQYYDAEREVTETYNAAGALLTLTDRHGLTQTLTYSANYSGRLDSVTDPFGRQLSFSYANPYGPITGISVNGVSMATYQYVTIGSSTMPSTVTYADGKTRTYLYENTGATTPAQQLALTGLIDENNQRIATWTYNTHAQVTAYQAAAGGEQLSLSYTTNYSGNTVYGFGPTTVTDGNGVSRQYVFDTIDGMANERSYAVNNGAAGATYTRDAHGNIASATDPNGNLTTYTYDLTRNLETSRTEAANSALARTISTQWHPTFRLPTQIDEPGKRTILTYDTQAHLTQRTITDTASGATRTWTYLNTYAATGALASQIIDGPRTDVVDQTRYDFDSAGNLSQIKNALGHITQITSYDINGLPLTIVDPNGLVTTLTYDGRGRLTSRKTGTETTGYAYDGIGQLTKITLPNGAFLTYTYDAGHHLTGVQDNLGNHIAYTLDTQGNRTKTQIYDPSNNLTQLNSAVYDALNRLQQTLGGVNPGAEITQYSYDANNNVTNTIDPLGHQTTNAFDALNRLVQVTDPNNGQTRYGYSALGQVTGVADSRNVTTGYAIDALGNAAQTQSPDAGVSQAVTDAAGNVIRRTDAKNQTTQYQYDALNRLTKETRADTTVVAYTYDAGTSQKGRLTGMTDPSGSTTWTYDLMGRVTQKNQVINGTTRTTKYTYDTKGQLASLTYPSGKVINYTWSNGKITAVKLGTTNIATNITYQPFGPVKAWTFNNGETVSRSFDLNGRMTQNSIGSIGYDNAGRITSAYGRTFGYDNLDRLTSYQDGSTAYTYSLDATGNRTQQIVNSTINNYAIDPMSNKILSISAGTTTKTYQHDANGSITSDGTYLFSYDAVKRLIQTAQGTTIKGTYAFNGLGQRVKKTANKATTLFAYDEAGHLIGEYSGSTLIQETVWLGDIPLATIRGSTVYYVHADHLNAPRKVTDGSKKLRWTWDVPSFGAITPNENPAKAGTFVYNLRFPGQYADTETGLYYNYFRDYDPKTGRYIESDPIGLGGGLNTYAYVHNNPISFADPTGEFAQIAIGAVIGGLSGLVGALNDPCASKSDIAKAVALGAVLGGASAAVPIGGPLLAAMGKNALAGFFGNTGGQLLTGGVDNYNVGQALTQGVVGAISGSFGNVVGLSTGVDMVRGGATAASAISTSLGVGTTSGIGMGTALNLAFPGSLGGLNPAGNNNNSCSCKQ